MCDEDQEGGWYEYLEASAGWILVVDRGVGSDSY